MSSPTSSSFPGTETIKRMNVSATESLTKFNTNYPLVSKVTLSVLALVFVLYASMAAPKLPASMLSYFDYPLVKLVFMFLIAFLAVKDFGTALIVSIALLGTLMVLKYYNTNSHLPPLSPLPVTVSNNSQSGMCVNSPNTNEMNMVPQQNIPDCVYASTNPNSSAPSPSEMTGPVTGDVNDANLTAGSVVSGFQGDDYCTY